MDEKMMEIMERASIVYMRLGIKSVTMDDLARELGISKKTIYKYFNDKNDLVRAIMEQKILMQCALCTNSQQQAENAIEDLIQLNETVIQDLSNINPTVFFDLKKYHRDAWQIMENYKWEFVFNAINNNIIRGIKEGIYRPDANAQIIAKLYVSSTDAIMNAEIFPWPEYKFQEVFTEMIRLFLNSLTNQKGKEYLEKRLKNDEK